VLREFKNLLPVLFVSYKYKLPTDYSDKVKFFLNSDYVIIILKVKVIFCCSLPTLSPSLCVLQLSNSAESIIALEKECQC